MQESAQLTVPKNPNESKKSAISTSNTSISLKQYDALATYLSNDGLVTSYCDIQDGRAIIGLNSTGTVSDVESIQHKLKLLSELLPLTKDALFFERDEYKLAPDQRGYPVLTLSKIANDTKRTLLADIENSKIDQATTEFLKAKVKTLEEIEEKALIMEQEIDQSAQKRVNVIPRVIACNGEIYKEYIALLSSLEKTRTLPEEKDLIQSIKTLPRNRGKIKGLNIEMMDYLIQSINGDPQYKKLSDTLTKDKNEFLEKHRIDQENSRNRSKRALTVLATSSSIYVDENLKCPDNVIKSIMESNIKIVLQNQTQGVAVHSEIAFIEELLKSNAEIKRKKSVEALQKLKPDLDEAKLNAGLSSIEERINTSDNIFQNSQKKILEMGCSMLACAYCTMLIEKLNEKLNKEIEIKFRGSMKNKEHGASQDSIFIYPGGYYVPNDPIFASLHLKMNALSANPTTQDKEKYYIYASLNSQYALDGKQNVLEKADPLNFLKHQEINSDLINPQLPRITDFLKRHLSPEEIDELATAQDNPSVKKERRQQDQNIEGEIEYHQKTSEELRHEGVVKDDRENPCALSILFQTLKKNPDTPSLHSIEPQSSIESKSFLSRELERRNAQANSQANNKSIEPKSFLDKELDRRNSQPHNKSDGKGF